MDIPTDKLCSEIEDFVNEGGGMLPLLGAGISVQSGVPATNELLKYLRLCVVMALGIDSEIYKGRHRRWHPQLDGWPEMRGDWAKRESDGTERLEEIIRNPDEEFSGENSAAVESFIEVCRQAYGAIVDWRIALQFVARVVAPPAKATACEKDYSQDLKESVERQPDLALGEVHQHVIDSFFNRLTDNKMPNMAHRMIVHFASALRSRVILSLNFDDLIEQAFREYGVHPTVFEVHYDASMPPWALLGTPPSVLKLHGGKYALRADLTLDQEPSEADRRSFRSYIFGEDWTLAEGERATARNHLIIAGVSGRDRRVQLLVVDALQHFDESLRIYWCCYSDFDEEAIQKDDDLRDPRVRTVRCPNAGLLLWEIYQRVTRSLPPGGLQFPTLWQIPAPPHFGKGEIKILDKYLSEKKADALKWFNDEKKSETPLIFRSKSDREEGASRAAFGLTVLAWHLFETWRTEASCIWLDSVDLKNIHELKERMLHAIASQLGSSHLDPPIHGLEDDKSHEIFLRELEDQIYASGREWVLFLNFRGSHGYLSDPFGRLGVGNDKPKSGQTAYDWIEGRRKNWEADWNGDHGGLKKLPVLIDEISKKRVRVVLLCHSDETSLSGVKGEPLEVTIDDPRISQAERDELMSWAENRADEAIEWVRREEDSFQRREKARWLRSLVLFQHVRHQTALVSRALLKIPPDDKNDTGKPRWQMAWEKTDQWLEELIKKKILRRMPGGFLLMNWDVREHLRYGLLTDQLFDEANRELEVLHIGIADWYMTFFHATKDPIAVFQAVYHRCRVAQITFNKCSKASANGMEGESHESEMSIEQNLVTFRGALSEANNHLETARASLLAWGNHIDARKCLEGYFKLLCALVDGMPDGQGRFMASYFTEFARGLVRGEPANGEHLERDKRNLRFLLMVKVKALLFRILLCRDLGDAMDVKAYVELYRSEWKHGWKSKRVGGVETQWKLYESEWEEEAFINDKFIEFEDSLAAITLRNYRDAETRLLALAGHRDIGFPLRELSNWSGDEVWGQVRNWVINGPASGGGVRKVRDKHRFAIRILMLHVLRRWSELRLLKYELKKAMACLDGDASNDFPVGDEPDLKEAEIAYLARTLLARFIPEEEYSRVRVERSRSHSIMAGVFIQRRDNFASFRHLNEASVAMFHLPESEESIAHAVIGLRKIYCILESLERLNCFNQYHRQIVHSLVGQERSWLPVEDWRSELRKAEILLSDAADVIVTVRDRMARDRKTLFWWMSLKRYEMAIFEFTMMICACSEAGRQANIGNLRAKIETEIVCAGQVMKDVCRRVTCDIYQFARILYSYCNCLRFYSIIVGRYTTKGYNALEEGVSKLRELEDRSRGSKEVSANCPDEEITEFVERVSTSVREVYQHIEAIQLREK